MQFKKDTKMIWDSLFGYRKRLFLLSLIAIIGSAIAAVIPFLYGRLVDYALDVNESIWLIFSMLSIWLVLSLIRDWTDRYLNNSGELLTTDIIHNFGFKVVSHILELPMRFHKDERIGKLLSRVFRSMDFLYMIINNSLFNFLPSFLTVIIAIVILFMISPLLSLVLMIILFFYSYISIKIAPSISKNQVKINSKYEKYYSHIYESITNIQVVKANANEEHESKKFKRGINAIIESLAGLMKSWRHLMVWQQTIFSFGFVALFGFSVFLLRAGEISPGELVTFVGYIALAFQPFSRLARSYALMERGMPAIYKAENTYRETAEEYFPEGGVDIDEIKGDIEFKNVYFKWPDDKKVFTGINFKIKAGEAVALVGESGSGKSTLVNLLQKYFIPQKGKILVDGQDIQKFNIGSYRSRIAIVPQEITMFNATVHQNIKYGNLQADTKDVRRAAREANADDFIKTFKKKYNQLVGERGIKLSVGQKQRIAIARAILRDPNLLILDEATSSLDSKAERQVHQALRRLVAGRTTIIIAHRFSTISFVDRIIVLRNGKIVEEGPHKKLMQQKGEYYKLYTAQMMDLDHDD